MLTEKRLDLFIKITLVLILVGIGASGYLFYKDRISVRLQSKPIIDQQIEALQSQVTKKPGDFDLRILLAKRLIERNRFDEAIGHLKIALELKKKAISANYLLGLSYKESGNEKSAITYFKKTLEVSKGQQFTKINTYIRDANFFLAEIYKDDKKYDLALKHYKVASGVGTADSDTLYNIGLVYVAKKDYKNAIDYFDKTLQFVPNYKEALASFEEALGKTANYAEGNYKLGTRYQFLTTLNSNAGKDEEAKESLAKAKEFMQEAAKLDSSSAKIKKALDEINKIKI